MKFASTFNRVFDEAEAYYASIDHELARRFIAAVDQAVDEISSFPKVGRFVRTYRVLPLKGFPFSICYEQAGDGGLTALVLHHHKQQQPAIG